MNCTASKKGYHVSGDFAITMANFPGLESLFASIESKITSNYDGLICFLHWNIVNRGFTCVGHGEDVSDVLCKLIKRDITCKRFCQI